MHPGYLYRPAEINTLIIMNKSTSFIIQAFINTVDTHLKNDIRIIEIKCGLYDVLYFKTRVYRQVSK